MNRFKQFKSTNIIRETKTIPRRWNIFEEYVCFKQLPKHQIKSPSNDVASEQICQKSAADLLANLQQTCRLSTDHLHNVCRISAKFPQTWSAKSLLNCRPFADVLQMMRNLGDRVEKTNCRRTADKKQTSNTNQMLFILKQRNTLGSVLLQQRNHARHSVDSYSDNLPSTFQSPENQCQPRHLINNFRYLNHYLSQITIIFLIFVAKITSNDLHYTYLVFSLYKQVIIVGTNMAFDGYCRTVFGWSTCCGLSHPERSIRFVKSTLNWIRDLLFAE